MYIKNRIFALVFRVIALILSIAGVIAISINGGVFSFKSWLFYTLMSNLVVVIYFIVVVFLTLKDLIKEGVEGSTSYFPKIAMILSVDILLTLLVFWILLAPTSFDMGSDFKLLSFANISVHTITPILMIIDFLLLNKRRALKFSDIFLVMIFPYSYMALSFILGFSGYVYMISNGENIYFPYFFLDIYNNGWMVLVYVLALTIVFWGVGMLCYLFDRKASDKEIYLRRAKTK
ncbi:MAG: hypothetical protein LBM99_03395 [Bacillales bacterium]|nr:hypothetical protein [Bacillales bacterium]